MESTVTMRPTHQAIANLGESVKMNNKIVCFGVFLCLAFACATFGLTLGAAEYSKESNVKDSVMVSKATHAPVQADSTVYTVDITADMNVYGMAMVEAVVFHREVNGATEVQTVRVARVESVAAGITVVSNDGKTFTFNNADHTATCDGAEWGVLTALSTAPKEMQSSIVDVHAQMDSGDKEVRIPGSRMTRGWERGR
jgi:hypothetical protein